MGDACEIVCHQGLDLYGAAGNRLLRGFEYTAAYNLGDEVDFHPYIDRTGKYRHQVNSPRGQLRPVYEQIFAHYHVRRGLPAPALERAIAKVRPEGAGQGADHTGFGTLLYALSPLDVHPGERSELPAALHAEMKSGAVELTWLVPRISSDCLLERTDAVGSIRRMKTTGSAEKFRDETVEKGKRYSYRLTTRSAEARELVSETVDIVAGIPPGWSDVALGSPSTQENAQFDGNVLAVRAAGRGLLGPSDEGCFVASAPGCASLNARFIPQTASQFVTFGVAWREGLAANAPSVALVILPASGDRERQGWHIRLLARDGHGEARTISDYPLGQSVSEYGRLMQSVWFQLQKKQSSIFAQFSTDGLLWKKAGQVEGLEGGLMGIIASSGVFGVDTVVRFDSLVVGAE
jgi:hypothetical protein